MEGGGDNRSYKTCKAPVKLSPQTNQHPAFYRPDALPVAHPTMSEHWRKTYTDEFGKRLGELCLFPVWNCCFLSPGRSLSLSSSDATLLTIWDSIPLFAARGRGSLPRLVIYGTAALTTPKVKVSLSILKAIFQVDLGSPLPECLHSGFYLS